MYDFGGILVIPDPCTIEPEMSTSTRKSFHSARSYWIQASPSHPALPFGPRLHSLVSEQLVNVVCLIYPSEDEAVILFPLGHHFVSSSHS
jgi:hypothetical protein